MLPLAHSAFTDQASLVTLQVAAEMIFMAAAPVPQQFTPTVLLLVTSALQ
jgi:hypothetical protein